MDGLGSFMYVRLRKRKWRGEGVRVVIRLLIVESNQAKPEPESTDKK